MSTYEQLHYVLIITDHDANLYYASEYGLADAAYKVLAFASSTDAEEYAKSYAANHGFDGVVWDYGNKDAEGMHFHGVTKPRENHPDVYLEFDILELEQPVKRWDERKVVVWFGFNPSLKALIGLRRMGFENVYVTNEKEAGEYNKDYTPFRQCREANSGRYMNAIVVDSDHETLLRILGAAFRYHRPHPNASEHGEYEPMILGYSPLLEDGKVYPRFRRWELKISYLEE